MPSDSPGLAEILERGAATGERYVAESIEIDKAWMNGTLHEWLKQKAEKEKQHDAGTPA